MLQSQHQYPSIRLFSHISLTQIISLALHGMLEVILCHLLHLVLTKVA